MRILAILLLIAKFSFGEEVPTKHKDTLMTFVSEEQPLEDILIDAFIALPQDFFQGTVRQLVLAVHNHATNPAVVLNEKDKTVKLIGDGGQATIKMTLLDWKQNVLKVRVDYSRESTEFSEILQRTKYGWSIQRMKK